MEENTRVRIKVITLENMVKNTKSYEFEDIIVRETKTKYITKNGFRFNKKDNWQEKSRKQRLIISKFIESYGPLGGGIAVIKEFYS